MDHDLSQRSPRDFFVSPQLTPLFYSARCCCSIYIAYSGWNNIPHGYSHATVGALRETAEV